jgi:hypothetical protein
MPKAIPVMTVHESEVCSCRKRINSILNRYPEFNVLVCIQSETEGFTPPVMNRVETHVMKPTHNPLEPISIAMKRYEKLPIISVQPNINYDSNCLEELYRMHEQFPNSICTAAFNIIKVSRNDDKVVATLSSLAERRKDTNLANKYYELVCAQETIYPAANSGSGFTFMYDCELRDFPLELREYHLDENNAHIFMSILCQDNGIEIRHLTPAMELPAPPYMEQLKKAVEDYYDKLIPPISHALPLKEDRLADDDMEITVVTSTKNRVLTMQEKDISRNFFFVDEEHEQPNIDKFNPWFCELTALYYLHKHSTAKYVGLEHYRRCFVMQDNGSYDPNAYNILSRYDARDILDEYDAIVTFHQHTPGRSAYSFLEVSHYTKMFNAWLDIVEEGTPGFKKFCLDWLHHDMLICCNMFIARKELIDKYCEWLFANTRAFMRKYPLSEKRYRHIGYLGEFTFGSWLLFNKYRLYLQPHIRFNKELTELEEVERTTICREEI